MTDSSEDDNAPQYSTDNEEESPFVRSTTPTSAPPRQGVVPTVGWPVERDVDDKAVLGSQGGSDALMDAETDESVSWRSAHWKALVLTRVLIAFSLESWRMMS